ncbi:plasmid mobilization protein [Pedobacter mucosus]|uniref:plasmid mobilization protein n=1 Tax=Pedobacter mucosus TaxID=2895286 RepID=UPI001EE4D7FE|nr:hypothetical protein [Pedobacter mucosus]UKT63054.1 hypothetical protein LOK61_14905 [Pedobacter mucosus]
METKQTVKRANKGGRPKVQLKRDCSLSVMCNIIEKKLIQVNARKFNTSSSVYLRELGIRGSVKLKVRTLPKEVLLLTGTLNHLAANLNQIARKRNAGQALSAVERIQLGQQIGALQQTVEEIRMHIR